MTQEKFKRMVIELHSYYDSNITMLTKRLKQAVINNTLNTFLESKWTMSNNEILEFKEKYNI